MTLLLIPLRTFLPLFFACEESFNVFFELIEGVEAAFFGYSVDFWVNYLGFLQFLFVLKNLELLDEFEQSI